MLAWKCLYFCVLIEASELVWEETNPEPNLLWPWGCLGQTSRRGQVGALEWEHSPPSRFSVLRKANGPCWIRPKSRLVQLPASYGGPPDAFLPLPQLLLV